jgi:hypothetical protein
MALCAVTARVQQAERMIEDARLTPDVAPLNAARTAQRAIPALLTPRLSVTPERGQALPPTWR